MTRVLNVYPLPELADPEDMGAAAAVVIDVLRASTTICHALEAGATEVIPCLEVDQARAVAGRLAGGAVLGGERGGLRIDGFDLGNSPGEYLPDQVAGKAVVLTTTNGTRTILHCRQADRVLIGAFVNATAVFEQLRRHERVDLLCAGTHGQASQDDLLLAGMLADRLVRHGGLVCQQNAEALRARQTWLRCFPVSEPLGTGPAQPRRLAAQLRNSVGGRHLVSIGLEDDILAAAQIDRFGRVPEMDPKKLRIRLM